MQTLANVIAALRREITAALVEGKELPSQVQIEADRAVLTLHVRLKSKQPSSAKEELHFEVIESGDDVKHTPSVHTLSLEFGLRKESTRDDTASESAASKPAPIRTTSNESTNRERDDWVKGLSTVLGPPGFDSSARATVLREALENLSNEQVLAVVRSFYDTPIPEGDAEAKRARHLILGVLKSGPLRSVEAGGEVLIKVFRADNAKAVLHLVAEKWKTQDDWLNEA